MVNLSRIFEDYYKQILNGNRLEKSIGVLLFLLIPLSVSILFFHTGLSLGDNMVNALITSVSIFAGLLLNLLVLVYDMAKGNNKDVKEIKGGLKIEKDEIQITLLESTLAHEKLRSNLLRNIFVGISYCVVISIIVIILLVFCLQANFRVFDLLSSFFLGHLMMSMLNVIRNVYIIFHNLPSTD